MNSDSPVTFVQTFKGRNRLETAEHIIREIERDIKDRRGLKWEWEKIDEEVKGEIRLRWHQIIMAHLIRK